MSNGTINWMSALSARNINLTVRFSSEMGRGPYHKDFGAIAYSNFFKRLSKKTQVYSLPENDHVRNRLTHSIEVSHIGRQLARILCLKLKTANGGGSSLLDSFSSDFEELTAAAWLAHDVGHPPFGHAGAKILNEILKNTHSSCFFDEGFDDNKQVVHLLLSNLMNESIDPTISLVASVLKKFDIKDVAYASEKSEVERILDKLSLTDLRHPASILMEAADDIAYICSDLEDYIDYYLEYRNYDILRNLAHNLDGILLTTADYKFKTNKNNISSKWSFLIEGMNEKNKSEKVEEFRNYLMRAMITHVADALDRVIADNPSIYELPVTFKKFIMMNRFFDETKKKYDDNILYWNKEGNNNGQRFYKVKQTCYDDFILQGRITAEQGLIAKSVLPELLEALWLITRDDYEKMDEFRSLSSSIQEYIKAVHPIKTGSQSVERAIVDYVAGMTDSFAVKELARLRPTRTRFLIAS